MPESHQLVQVCGDHLVNLKILVINGTLSKCRYRQISIKQSDWTEKYLKQNRHWSPVTSLGSAPSVNVFRLEIIPGKLAHTVYIISTPRPGLSSHTGTLIGASPSAAVTEENIQQIVLMKQREK